MRLLTVESTYFVPYIVNQVRMGMGTKQQYILI